MIISGGLGQNSSSVEVISPTGNVSCSLPNMSIGRKEHTHDKKFICGGTAVTQNMGDTVLDYAAAGVEFCVSLTSSGWVVSHKRYPRWHHSSWAVDDGIILMGGHGYGRYTDINTEMMKTDGTFIANPFPLNYSTTL